MNDFPQPPLDIAMPATAQLVVTSAIGLLVLVCLVAALLRLRKDRSPVLLLAMLGGLLAMVNEPVGDALIQCWHPAPGQWTVFETLGRPIPLWAVLCYPLYFGAMPYLFYRLFRRGLTRKTFWAVTVAVLVVIGTFESLIISRGVFLYYGYQPFRLGQFPVTISLVNYMGMVGIGLWLALFADRLRGAQWLWMLFVPGLLQLAAFATLLPHIATLNTNAPAAVKYLGATVSALICIAVADAIARYSERRFAPKTAAAL